MSGGAAEFGVPCGGVEAGARTGTGAGGNGSSGILVVVTACHLCLSQNTPPPAPPYLSAERLRRTCPTCLPPRWLYSNQLTSVPPEIGELTELRRLWLDRNQLTHLPKEISKLTRLQVGVGVGA